MSEPTSFTRVATPLGDMVLAARDDALVYAQFADRYLVGLPAGAIEDAQAAVLLEARTALERFFAGEALAMPVPLAPEGTAFQRAVWSAISCIAHAHTATYGDIANAMGLPRAVRAVGAATGRNPLCLFIACHRVVGAGGALTGYAGGIERKRALLALEARNAPSLNASAACTPGARLAPAGAMSLSSPAGGA